MILTPKLGYKVTDKFAVKDSENAKNLLDRELLSLGEINRIVDAFSQDHKALILLLGKDLYIHYQKAGAFNTSKSMQAISFEDFCEAHSTEIKKEALVQSKLLYNNLLVKNKELLNGKNKAMTILTANELLHKNIQASKLPSAKTILPELKSVLKTLEKMKQKPIKLLEYDFILDSYKKLEKNAELEASIAGILLSDLLMNGTSTEKNKFKSYNKKTQNNIIAYYNEQGIDLQFGAVCAQLKTKINKLLTTSQTKKNQNKKRELTKNLNTSIEKSKIEAQAKSKAEAIYKDKYEKLLQQGTNEFFSEEEKNQIKNINMNIIERAKSITIPYDLMGTINASEKVGEKELLKGDKGFLYGNPKTVSILENNKSEFERLLKTKKRGNIRGFLFEKIIEYMQIMYVSYLAYEEGATGIFLKTEARDDTFGKSDAIYYDSKKGQISSIDFGITIKKEKEAVIYEEENIGTSKGEEAKKLRNQVGTTAYILEKFQEPGSSIDIIENQRYPFLKLPEEVLPVLAEMFQDALVNKKMTQKNFWNIVKKYEELRAVKGLHAEDVMKDLLALSTSLRKAS